MEIEAKPKIDEKAIKEEGLVDESELSPIEEVRLTVPNTDDPSLPPLVITQITVQVATLPIGRFMASALPTTKLRIPGFGSREFSLNPGPFNMKEHVLITIFANAGSAFGNDTVYAVGYGIWMGGATEKVCGRAGAYVVVFNPRSSFSLFRTLHEKEENSDGKLRISRVKFFVIALVCSFCWYIFPGYFFLTLQSISWVCLAFPHSVTAHQIGSGMNGLGIGAFTLDWTTVSSFLFSPLVSPFFAIANVFIGYALIIYFVMPVSYWGLNLFNAITFPIYSSDLFTAEGQSYNISKIVNDKFKLDVQEYDKIGRVHLSTFFAITYEFGFATIASTDIPSWWFYLLLAVSILVGLALFIFLKKEVQMTWWGLIFAAALSLFFTLPISIISATTNQTPGLNIITEYIMGVILPGQPIANVCFKTYGYMSMAHAVSFLSDFKLGHYMKIPPRSMFLVQFIGTMLAGTVNVGVAWWLLTSIDNICHRNLLPTNSPWTCPSDRVFFDASVIWVWPDRKRFSALKGCIESYGGKRYNYILSAALDAGVAFMTVLLYFALGIENKSLNCWGASPDIFPEHCDLAYCPTAKGISGAQHFKLHV
ncbi:Oligopeptide transporter 2 [Hibiscus syriacus]|uniref:Oligopeptide transporter 2 n=1 Tax=Hibiscus syriacus TaxID=106335 RepID=A0A6A2YYB5_HIBSY|nr:Oligopeptide transporter 2 [Hibiscus syriacus]